MEPSSLAAYPQHFLYSKPPYTVGRGWVQPASSAGVSLPLSSYDSEALLTTGLTFLGFSELWLFPT